MSRIAAAFKELRLTGRKGFIPFLTAGDPDLATTSLLLLELQAAGSTLIELGVPFSDPMADGPVIQRSSERALKNGVGLQQILETVGNLGDRLTTPIVLFTYFNPLLQFGPDRLARLARANNIDGVLVTDVTPEEAANLVNQLRASDLDMIFLVAPTSTDDRLALITKQASGFIYAVSRTGVTGERDSVSAEAEELVGRVRTFSDLPVAVGFGISTVEQVRDVQRYADAAVVGSAIVAEIEKLNRDPHLVSRLGAFVRNLVGSSH
ncbi:MAG: tryptophan synthase subunit alpha [Pyrinomonadaceae bacterium]